MCRDGHGSIVLTIDSRRDEKTVHHDVNVHSDSLYNKWKEHKLCWIDSVWNTRAENNLKKIAFVAMLATLKDEVITTLSMSISTPEWFMIRLFSFVSHTADRAVNTILKLN